MARADRPRGVAVHREPVQILTGRVSQSHESPKAWSVEEEICGYETSAYGAS